MRNGHSSDVGDLNINPGTAKSESRYGGGLISFENRLPVEMPPLIWTLKCMAQHLLQKEWLQDKWLIFSLDVGVKQTGQLVEESRLVLEKPEGEEEKEEEHSFGGFIWHDIKSSSELAR